MKSNLKTYGKYPIRRLNGIRQYDKKGDPILDEKVKTVRIDPSTAKTLNRNASNFGYVYKEEVEEIKEPEEEVTTDELDELRTKAKALKIKGAHMMGKEKLEAKIKEAEGN